MSPQAAEAEEDAYFSSNPPPRQLSAHVAQAQAFIASHASAARRVVLVTSGGTTVPLERNTVRFLDNFSAGTRGAASAEHFLAAGYAVIFLHREFSLLPFSRHYSHSADSFLDYLCEAGVDDVDDDEDDDDVQHRPPRPSAAAASSPTCGPLPHITVRRNVHPPMLPLLRRYRRAKEQNRLLVLPFVTIGDYLHELRAISRLMRPLGPSGLLYLAAAVSDFFVPPERLPDHKIQSTDAVDPRPPAKSNKTAPQQQAQEATRDEDDEETFDNFDSSPRVPRSKRLIIDLDPVPKFLKNLVDGWAPEGMIVSYKLETDPSILVRKARYSLDRYQHHLVIGNLLATRKWEVVFVRPRSDDAWLRVSRRGGWGDADGRPLRPNEVPSGEPEEEIEGLIIPAVGELHDAHIRDFTRE